MALHDDTGIGGPGGGQFPTTHASAILAARSEDRAVAARSFGALVQAYWKPIYKYVRIRWRKGNEEAKDLTQAFFTGAMERGLFQRFDPAKARFRTYLRTCLDGFLGHEAEAASRQKRGGGVELVPLDFEAAEAELAGEGSAAEALSPDRYFEQEWARALFQLAVEALRARLEADGKAVHYALFEAYDLCEGERPPTYGVLAERHGLPVTTVTNHLALARRELRALVLEKLRELTASEEEYQGEARLLLGAR
ncbi:MAG TPA: sigma-70 family RNA polymerase sigma factor [Myxococcaceae bacterium]|jgi:RNA polymerase sigma factor (sigma-70 family)